MLLRESSKALGAGRAGRAGRADRAAGAVGETSGVDELDGLPALTATVGGGGDGGVPHGEALVRFAETVTKGTDDVSAARAQLIDEVGAEGFVQACAIVGIFNGLVRTADASGIPLDSSTLSASRDFRGELGLDQFLSAANTELHPVGESGIASGDAARQDVAKLFA